jgi:hypothetical protein
VKYHLFTLMVFDFHRIGALVAWLSWVGKHVKTWWNGRVPYMQSFFCICQIGDHHVSLWMMPKNLEHCGKMYIDLYFLLHSLMFWYYVNLRIP